MSELELIKWGAYALVGITGWFVRVLWEGQKEMRKDMMAIEKELNTNYYNKPEIKDMLADIKESWKEAVSPIIQKLDKFETYILEKRDKQ